MIRTKLQNVQSIYQIFDNGIGYMPTMDAREHYQRFPKIKSAVFKLRNSVAEHCVKPLLINPFLYTINTQSQSQLTRLSIEHFECSDLTYFISHLPFCLTFLKLAWYRENSEVFDGATIFKTLPKSLITLKLPSLEFSSELPERLSYLPPHLTSLNLELIELTRIDVVYLPKMLRYLTCARLLACHGYLPMLHKLVLAADNNIWLIDDDIASLPRTLVTLETGPTPWHPTLNIIRENAFDKLPQSLTSLSIDFTVSKANMAKIPSSVTRLFLSQSLTSYDWKHLPRKLIQCDARSNVYKWKHLKNLPPTLTQLHLHIVTPPSDGGPVVDRLAKLPSKLTSLKFHDQQYGLVNNDIMYLPSSLTSLACNLKFQKPGGESCGRTFNPGLAPKLPSALIKFDGTYFSRNIKSAFLVSDDFIQWLPRSIIVLVLGNINLTDQSIRKLPPRLQKLEIEGESSRKLTDAMVSDFPKTLKHLIIPHAIQLTNLCMSDMPRSLRTLNISENTSGFSEVCFDHIPRFVRTLNLRFMYRTEHETNLMYRAHVLGDAFMRKEAIVRKYSW
jgi:hypothetical protein